MKRVQGGEGIALIECINPRYRKYRVRWDLQPYINEEGEQQGVSFAEAEFTHKPGLEEVKKVVLDWMNGQIDNDILSGFTWEGMAVWLSSENQFNYKAAYDLAVQTGGANLPVTFKFGTTEEPVYHEFKELSELTDFYVKAMKYINDTLAEGWTKKDAMEWGEYERLLEE